MLLSKLVDGHETSSCTRRRSGLKLEYPMRHLSSRVIPEGLKLKLKAVCCTSSPNRTDATSFSMEPSMSGQRFRRKGSCDSV
jgi:hypothetical protein